MSTDLTPLPAALARPTQATAIEQARAVAEVAAAVQVAQMNPRDMRRAWADMQAACSRMGLAECAFYRVPNRGTGPSVHLARELARIWGNMDYGVHELSRDDDRGMSEVRAYAWDQQTNMRSSRTFQVPHARMVGKDRKPLTDLQDIYLSNQNIGARAVRETILAALPKDFASTASAGSGPPRTSPTWAWCTGRSPRARRPSTTSSRPSWSPSPSSTAARRPRRAASSDPEPDRPGRCRRSTHGQARRGRRLRSVLHVPAPGPTPRQLRLLDRRV
jgi:hypothetical protein